MRSPSLTGATATPALRSADQCVLTGSAGTAWRSAAVTAPASELSAASIRANALQDVVVSPLGTPYNSVSSPREAPNHCRPRLRIAIHAVDRATPARTLRVLRNPALQHADRGHPVPQARRYRALRRTPECIGGVGAALRAWGLRRRGAGARDLLRHAAHDRCARWRSRRRAASRVRAGDDHDRARGA